MPQKNRCEDYDLSSTINTTVLCLWKKKSIFPLVLLCTNGGGDLHIKVNVAMVLWEQGEASYYFMPFVRGWVIFWGGLLSPFFSSTNWNFTKKKGGGGHLSHAEVGETRILGRVQAWKLPQDECLGPLWTLPGFKMSFRFTCIICNTTSVILEASNVHLMACFSMEIIAAPPPEFRKTEDQTHPVSMQSIFSALKVVWLKSH